MNYSIEQLCEIYYLFHEYDSKCIQDIENKYPELLKYKDILRHICFQLEIFRGEYSVFFGEFKFTGPLYVNHHNTSVYAMRELIKILQNVEEDQLSLIDDELLMRISFSYNRLYIDKIKSILTPAQMASDDLHEYIANFELMLDEEMCVNSFTKVKYNGLNIIERKSFEFTKYAEAHFKNNYRSHVFVDMILAYFYAHLEKYDYNFENLDILIQRFEERALEYVSDYDSKHEKRHDILGGLIVDAMKVYHYIESIIDKLLEEKDIVRRLK